MDNTIKLYSISELLEKNFYIPSYQRGYRWTKQQVEDLLNDINEFDLSKKTWYCLQPIVVKQKSENEWDVIDGQQRLTTIFLVIHYMNEMWKEKEKNNEFNLRFETRDKSQEFLKNILVDKISDEVVVNDENIDFHFISKAYRTIHNWVKSNDKLVTGNFESKFIHSSKIIWYETSINDDSIDIFTRINSGKIPLTNAELIKALFLNSSNFEKADNEKLRLKQLEIASEWDSIEYALHDDSFWYFINKIENNLATRIEFIFNLMSDKPSDDKYSTFHFFNEKFKTKSEKEINDNWQEIKKYFQTLEEWYNDRELYHKIGYLIAVGTNIKDILNKKNENTLLKSDFLKWIDNEIKDIASKKQVDELEYEQDNGQLINVLLLHNIITTLNSDDSSLRFPFNKYKDKKNGGWSLEHIHAQNSEDITEIGDFNQWLKVLDSKEFTESITKQLSDYESDNKKEKVPQLVKEISLLFGEPDIHSIENMALLSKNDNSKLNNGLFPVKRERIIELEKNGAFIPISTRKVFQKYFEGCTKQLSKWEKNDRSAYLNDIKETLKFYLP